MLDELSLPSRAAPSSFRRASYWRKSRTCSDEWRQSMLRGGPSAPPGFSPRMIWCVRTVTEENRTAFFFFGRFFAALRRQVAAVLPLLVVDSVTLLLEHMFSLWWV